MVFDKSDRACVAGLIKIMDEATYPLKKKEMAAFLTVVNWVGTLKEKMEKCDALGSECTQLRRELAELKAKPKRVRKKKA